MLEILCAREERRMMQRIGAAIASYCEPTPFPQFSVSQDMRGTLHPSTILGQSFGWVLAGCTTLGNPIQIELEIVHDETWIPVVLISSTELDEPLLFVVEKHSDETFETAMEVLDTLIKAATARSKYEREHLPELLEGCSNFTIYE